MRVPDVVRTSVARVGVPRLDRPGVARASAPAPLAAIALASLLVAGCGGAAHQDAHEPNATFTVKVVHASFPAKQAVARPAVLTLKVRNASARTIPNVAVTINAFDYASDYPELAANKRPIWIVDQGPGAIPKLPVQSQAVDPPGGGQTAYVNTWALGRLAPGATQTFAWHVTPIKPGVHTVHFTVAAGLAGKAKAQLASGAVPGGSFTATIAPQPPSTYINPNTGKVTPGTYPPAIPTLP